MHDDRSGEIVEAGAESLRQPVLHAERLVPGDALEEGIDEADDQEGRRQLRMEARALGDAAGDDRRDRRGEGEQEEELGQLVAVLRHQRLGAGEEVDPVGDAVADEEVGDRRHREVGEDLHQRIDLVLLAHGADFEKREAGVHRQHHDPAEQDEKDVAARLERFHGASRKSDGRT